MNLPLHKLVDDANLYGREYFDGYYLNDRRRESMYKQEYKRIQGRIQPSRVLDIGCGIGGFLNCFDDRWDKYGYEPSEFAASKAAKHGIMMMRNLHTLDTESMDLVILRGSIQHINFPMETLVQATRILRRGGLLAILATPDTDSLVYKLWGNLPALDAPRNWILFGSRMLSNILKRLGYERVEVIHPYLGSPYAEPFKDFGKFFLSLFFGWRKFAFPGNMMEVYAVKQ